MAKSLAQKAADRGLDEAVQRVFEVYELVPGHMLIDFAIVMETVSPDIDDDGDANSEGYAMAFRNGCRETVAIGLMNKGLQLIAGMHDEGDE